MFEDPIRDAHFNPASVQEPLTTTLGLWKTPITNSPSRIKTWRIFPFPFHIRTIVTILFCSFDAFGLLSKGQILMMDALMRVPTGFATWIIETDQRPGMVRVREHRKYAHEVAAKLIEEKRKELKDGTSQRDIMTSLGSS